MKRKNTRKYRITVPFMKLFQTVRRMPIRKKSREQSRKIQHKHRIFWKQTELEPELTSLPCGVNSDHRLQDKNKNFESTFQNICSHVEMIHKEQSCYYKVLAFHFT